MAEYDPSQIEKIRKEKYDAVVEDGEGRAIWPTYTNQIYLDPVKNVRKATT